MALSPQAQQETQKAALRYERAVSMHNAAREMVFVAEQGVMADKNRLDPTWQEMLNHATCKVGWLCLLVPRGPLLPRCPCTYPLLSYLLPSSLPSAAPVSNLSLFCPVWPPEPSPPDRGPTQALHPCWTLWFNSSHLFSEHSPFCAFELCHCSLTLEVSFVYHFQAT